MKPAIYGLCAAAVLCLVLAALIALALPVMAEPVFECSDTAQVIGGLDKQYGEKEAGQGVTRNGLLARLMVGPNTWTMVISFPDGVSCLVLSGEGWQAVQGGSL